MPVECAEDLRLRQKRKPISFARELIARRKLDLAKLTVTRIEEDPSDSTDFGLATEDLARAEGREIQHLADIKGKFPDFRVQEEE
jgi:hypothetical protein